MLWSMASNLLGYLALLYLASAVKLSSTVSSFASVLTDSNAAKTSNSSFAIRFKTQSRALERQMHARVNMDCPMFAELHKDRMFGAFHAEECIGRGFDGELWKASEKTGGAKPPVVLKVLNWEFASIEKATHDCSFARSLHNHMPDKFVNCVGSIEKTTLGDQDTYIYILELAEGKGVLEWLQEAGGEAPTPLPNLKSAFKLALDIWDAVTTLENGFGQMRYMYDDHHLGNVVLNAAGSWKFANYGHTRTCCGADATDCAPVKVSPILKFVNLVGLLTGLDVMAWPDKVKSVYLGGTSGSPAENVTASDALQEFLPIVRAAYRADFDSVEAGAIVEKGLNMMLLDRSKEGTMQRVNELASEIKAMAMTALARLEKPSQPEIARPTPSEAFDTKKNASS